MELSDLLGDNSTSNKEKKSRRGDFLGALQKSKSINLPENSVTNANRNYGVTNTNTSNSNNAFDENEELRNPNKVIEIDQDVEIFERDREKSNFTSQYSDETNRNYAKSGSNFFTTGITETNTKKNLTSTGFFPSENKTEEPSTTSTFVSRRKSIMPSNNENSPPKTEDNSTSTAALKRLERRNTVVSGITETLNEDDGMSNVYVPSISKNSRRARGTLKENTLSNIPESNSRGGSNDQEGSKTSSAGFKDNKDNKDFNKEKEEVSQYQPKTLLKSSKSFNSSNLSFSDVKNITDKETDSPDFNKNMLPNPNANVTSNINNNANVTIQENNNLFKTYNRQDTTLSFRGDTNAVISYSDNNANFSPTKDSIFLNNNNNNNNNTNYSNSPRQDRSNQPPTDIKSSTEKEQLESQLTILKQRQDDEKRRYESLLTEEKEKSKRKEDGLNKFIEDLKNRHKEELKSNEEKNRSIIDSLTEDNKKLKQEIDKEIQNEKERHVTLHRSDLENQENIFKRNFETQKKFYEEQNETLKKQLQQQIEFNKLANKVEVSTKQIDEILQKFYQEKDKSIEEEKGALESKEKSLADLEEKLKDNERVLNREKETILQMRKDLDLREIEKKREHQEEKLRVEKEIARLQELQNSLKILEFNAKEKYEREKLEYIHKQAEMKIEMDTLKNEFHQRLSDLEYNRKIFEEEKRFFEKFKDEAIKNIEFKKVSLEERKKQFSEEEREIKGRIKVLQEKEFYLVEKFEEMERAKAEVEEAEKKSEKDRRELMIAAKRIEENIKNLEEKNKLFEREKEEVIRKYQELEAERSNINNEKLKIEQAKTELRLRLQSVDMLRVKYVSSSLDNVGNLHLPVSLPHTKSPSYDMSPFQNVNSIPVRTPSYGMNYVPNNEYRNSRTFSQTSNVRKSVNADEYIENFKAKLGDRDKEYSYNPRENVNKFIQQEKEYLRYSIDNLENNVKKDYEKLSQEYISSLQKANFNPEASLNVNKLRNEKAFDYVSEMEANSKIKEENKTLSHFNIKSNTGMSGNLGNNNFQNSYVKSSDFTSKSKTASTHLVDAKPQQIKKNMFDEFEEIVGDEVKNNNVNNNVKTISQKGEKVQVNNYDDEVQEIDDF